MKKVFTLALLAVAGTTAAFAQAEAPAQVKSLYSGEPVEVTWENTLSIEAEKFAEGVNIGDYIYVTFEKTTDVIELKSNGTWLPGSRLTNLGDNTADMKCYITSAGLTALRNYGLELCGASFTVSSVNVMSDGFQMPDGAIWGGYFWVENWNTLELFKTAFDNYSGQKYLVVEFAADKADFNNYTINVMTKFDTPEAVWGNNEKNVERRSTKAIVDLSGIDVAAALADVNTLLIQLNPGEGNAPFNVTAVTLTDTKPTSAVADIEIAADAAADTSVYNLQGIAVGTELNGLPAGLYIRGGKKYVVK